MKRGIRPRTIAAFTLIELLVVISIIALLLAILLPSLMGARRLAQRVVCAAQMAEMGKGMFEYATESSSGGGIDSPPGGPGESGAYLYGAPVAFGAAVQRWDFMGPMAKMWGMDDIPLCDGTVQSVIERFNGIRGRKPFLCASNNYLAAWFSGPNARTGPMVSYNTSRYMMWQQEPFMNDMGEQWISWYNGTSHEEKTPKGWKPSLTRVGDASKKMYFADGARYSTAAIAPDYDLSLHASYGGAFSDASAASTFSRSWDRSRAPGNGGSGNVDPREYAFRHSQGIPQVGAVGNAYKFEAQFMDGHVETMGDLDASSPYLWLPAGSKMDTSSVYNDTRLRFGLSGTINIGS